MANRGMKEVSYVLNGFACSPSGPVYISKPAVYVVINRP